MSDLVEAILLEVLYAQYCAQFTTAGRHPRSRIAWYAACIGVVSLTWPTGEYLCWRA
jgi:hypothetical protein